VTVRIEVDPIRCEAHGLCAELLPECIVLDEWGYPVIDGTPVPRALEDLARRAASACPTLALRVRAIELTDLGREPPASSAPRRSDDAPRPYQVHRQRRFFQR
jgi:ferredoxin